MSIIAGSYDDMQGGICYGGIAHAGPPRLQRAMLFDGLNDSVSVPTSIASPHNGVTIGCIVLRLETPTGFYPSIINLSLPTGQQFSCAFDGNLMNLSAAIRVQGATVPINAKVPIASIPLFAAVHIAATWQSGEPLRLYVNGVLASQTIPITGTLSACPLFHIGRPIINPNNTIDMIIRNSTLFPRSLSSLEIAALANGSIPSGCIGYWKGTGTDLSDWQDFSGMENHATAIIGDPLPAYIRGDGKIIVNGVVMNP